MKIFLSMENNNCQNTENLPISDYKKIGHYKILIFIFPKWVFLTSLHAWFDHIVVFLKINCVRQIHRNFYFDIKIGCFIYSTSFKLAIFNLLHEPIV